jgi:hypothetical protein
MLEHAEDAQLTLLIDQGVVRDNREIEVQKSGDSDGGNDVVLFDLIYHIHALGDLTEHSVHPVEMRLGRVGDEELTPARVLAGVGHGQGAGGVFVGVEVGLTLDLISRATGADPRIIGILGEGIAALNHEIRDHPVEPGPVVELAIRKLLEVLDGIGNFPVEQLGHDRAFAGRDGCRFGHVS